MPSSATHFKPAGRNPLCHGIQQKNKPKNGLCRAAFDVFRTGNKSEINRNQAPSSPILQRQKMGQNIIVNQRSLWVLAVCLCAILTGQAQTFTTLYSFTGGNDGGNPLGGLVQGSDGNLYGTRFNGGTNSAGTVFKVSSSGVFTSLYSFTGGNDGANPAAGLVPYTRTPRKR